MGFMTKDVPVGGIALTAFVLVLLALLLLRRSKKTKNLPAGDVPVDPMIEPETLSAGGQSFVSEGGLSDVSGAVIADDHPGDVALDLSPFDPEEDPRDANAHGFSGPANDSDKEREMRFEERPESSFASDSHPDSVKYVEGFRI
jgi:hypothetical protein